MHFAALDLIQKGMLFALQDWIKAGNRLRAPEDPESGEHLLTAATDTGFHSVLEELLRAADWSLGALALALETALGKQRRDLADLLLHHGAPIARVNFFSVCQTFSFDLMERFLREGGNPSHENRFAEVLETFVPRPFLKFFNNFRVEFPALED